MANAKKYRTVTLASLGAKLPIGFRGSADYSVREWTAQEEILIGEAIGDDPTRLVGHYCESLLSVLASSFGGLKIWNGGERLMDATEFGLALQSAWMPDVLTAYAFLRYKSIKAPLKLSLRDPDDRGKPFEFLADIGSLEIRVPIGSEFPTWEHQLVAPVTMGGKRITRLVMGPQRWNAIRGLQGNEVISRINVIASSVRGIPEFDERVEDASIDMIAAMRLGKEDLKQLADGIEQNGLGPVFTAEAKSPKSHRPFTVAIPWRYEDFFE